MKRFLLLLLLVVVLAAVPLGACAGKSEEQGVPMPEPAPAPPDMDKGFTTEEASSNWGGGSGDGYADIERIIVRSGNMSLVVDDVSAARDDITALAEAAGGYVVSSHIWGDEENPSGRLSIRVPEETFESTLSALRDLSVRVENESTESRDVTEEYVDLQARLGNAEATEAQYLALLEKADTVEDTLNIYRALSQIRQEIEQLKGRIQYLEQTAAMSLITINLEPSSSGAALVKPGWNAGEILKGAVRGLTVFGQGLATALLWVLIFSPVWGAIVGIIVWQRKRRQRKTSA